MKITRDELAAYGFRRGGTVFPDPATVLRVEIERDFTGFVVYMMVVNDEVMKAGKTEGGFRTRMLSSFNSLKNKMGDKADHPRYQEQTFKEHAQATIRAGHQVELWATSCETGAQMLAMEKELNDKYRGIWTKEGKHRNTNRGFPSIARHVERR